MSNVIKCFVNPEDLKNVAITCRCGKRQVTEIVTTLQDIIIVADCLLCGRHYGIHVINNTYRVVTTDDNGRIQELKLKKNTTWEAVGSKYVN